MTYGAIALAAAPTGSAVPWSHLFQGLKLTEITSLFYVRHRDYSASLGRFIERDPIGFEAGDNNWYRFVGNSPLALVDPWGLCAETCCCVDDLLIQDVERYVDTTGNDMGITLSRWGHSFRVVASLTNKPGTGSKCTLEWFERSTSGTQWTKEDHIDHTRWHDAYKLFKEKDGNATAENWLKYEKREAPYKDMALGPFTIVAIDTPSMPRMSSGERRIAIRVSSAEGCDCPNPSVTRGFTQKLVSTGKWDPFIDQLTKTPRAGEGWEGDASSEFPDVPFGGS